MIKILTYKNFLRLRIFQPNGSLLNRVLGVLVCLLALMCFGVLTCLHLRILGVFTCLRVYAWTMLACSVSLCADMIYMFVVLKYLTCLRACMFFDIVCPIFFAFEKLTSKNPHIEKILFIQISI